MTDLVRRQILLKDIIRINFEELDSEWPKDMWDSDGDELLTTF
jgi:hypothetical protein